LKKDNPYTNLNIIELLKKHIREIILLVIYMGMFIPALSYSYVQPTDPVWVQRGVQFYEAFRHGDFAQTYTKYHPGVILMWITGISYKIFYAFQKIHFGYIRDLFLHQADLYSMYSFIAKFFIVAVIMIVLLYCYSVVKRLINSTFAFWMTFFIITEPFVIGNIRSIHVDALAAFFMFASVISFWALQVGGFSSKKYLVLTGLFTGFALLTKISSLVLFPFFSAGVLVGLHFLKKGVTLVNLFRATKFLLLISAISLLVFSALFPAMWVNPIGTVQRIVTDGFLDTALNEESSRIVLSGDIASLTYKYLSYFVQIVFRTSPLVLVGSLLGLLIFIWCPFYSHKIIEASNYGLKLFSSGIVPKGLSRMSLLLFYSLVFILGYYLMISISDKKIFRYILPLYPFLAIFAAYGVSLGVRPLRGLSPIFVPIFVILYQLFQPLSVYPNFFAYFNPLLGGIETASKVISINQDATGYYIVGEYLNQKPNAENITVGCYDSGPMSTYFRGHTVKLKLLDVSAEYAKDLDYILLPVQEGWQYLPKEDYALDKVFRINNFDYWYLFRRGYSTL